MKKLQRELLSPIMHTLNLSPEMGLFHSALMIGPWLLEWNNSAICIPRKCVSTASILSADIDSITTSKKVDETVDILARIITDWNVVAQYNNFSSKKGEANCQDFVEEVLKHLDIQSKFSGPLDAFIKQLREKGKSELAFLGLDNDFIQKFNLNKKTSSVY